MGLTIGPQQQSRATLVDSTDTFKGTTARIQTMLRETAGAAIPLTNGTVLLNYVTAPGTEPITKLGFQTRGTAQSGATLVRFALLLENADGTLTLVARTANDTTLLASTFTVYEKALDTTGGYPASYTVTKGQRYVLAVLHVGTTTAAQLYGASFPGSSMSPIICATVSGQTDIPTTINAIGGSAPALVANGNMAWGVLTP